MLMQICMNSIWKQKNNFLRDILSFFLIISILISFTTPVFATEFEETYYRTITVHYYGESDNDEQWDVMVKGKHVYIEASYLGTMLGYNCKREGDLVSIYPNNSFAESRLPPISVHYKINKSVVYYNPLFGAEFKYDTPAPCIENEKGVWVPLAYTLVLLGGNSTFDNETLIITRPRDNVLSIAARIVNNEKLTSFDWENDLGYSETSTVVSNASARVVTLFKGLIEFDGASWLGVVDWNAFDRKFGRSFVGLFCESSEEEFREGLKEIDVLNDAFGTDGKVGQMLRNKQMRINSDVSVWKNACEEYLEVLESGSGSPTKYNLLYRQYERAMDDQNLFAALGAENTIYIQNELSTATNVLDVISIIGKGVSYYEECMSKDSYQSTVLSDYLRTRSKTGKISEATAKSMYDYMSSMDKRGWYIFWSFIRDEGLEFVVDESGLDAYLGVPANVLLFAWDIMSTSIPFYKDGIEAIGSREISNYAQKVQNDAYENINAVLNSMRNNPSEINEKECMKLSEYCYVYLKACYIARSAGIKSLDSISDEKKKEIKNKLDVLEDTNEIIARYLAVLSSSNADNERYILGFLPKYNSEFLEKRPDDGALATFAMNSDNMSKCEFIEVSEYLDSNPEELIELFDMQINTPWQFGDAAESYHYDDFVVEWKKSTDYTMTSAGLGLNTEADDGRIYNVSLYGIILGMTGEEVKNKLTSNGYIPVGSDNYPSRDFYAKNENGKRYGIYMQFYENQLSSWYWCNWREGEDLPDVDPYTYEIYRNPLLEFIQDGGYLEYTKDWSLPVKKYCFFDLNQDGTKELIIASEDYGSGFADYQVYALQNSKIVMIDNFTACYGITYSEKYHSVVFSDTRPSVDSQSRLFEAYDGTKMVDIFYIQEDLDTDTWEQVYTKIEGNVKNTLTEDEYMQYLTETTDITEWLDF